ncbi:hypothetical protein C8J57DRAFT_1514730 [Mycena rebaudengoi]|nr:hypothetical protein C8J57DRAFT_1514730 [Mycena rebaudengoi]
MSLNSTAQTEIFEANNSSHKIPKGKNHPALYCCVQKDGEDPKTPKNVNLADDAQQKSPSIVVEHQGRGFPHIYLLIDTGEN